MLDTSIPALPRTDYGDIFARSAAVNVPLALGIAGAVIMIAGFIGLFRQWEQDDARNRAFVRVLARDPSIPVDTVIGFMRSPRPIDEACFMIEDGVTPHESQFREALANAI